jgi:hypothetical protein
MSSDITYRYKECECASHYYEKTWDFSQDGSPPVWKCTNCPKMTKRTTRTRRTDTVTRTQRKLAEAIKNRPLRGETTIVWEDYKEELTESGHLIVSGRLVKSDGNQSLFDAHVLVFISRRGGVTGHVGAPLSKERKLKSQRDLWMIYR